MSTTGGFAVADTAVYLLSEDGEIKYIKFNDYISFVQSAESANDESFKDFRNAAQME